MKAVIILLLMIKAIQASSQTVDEFDSLMNERKYEKAWNVARAMINNDSSAPVGYGQIGRLYGYKGVYDSGILYLEQALKLDDGRTYVSGWAHANLGYIYIHKGYRTKGVEELRTAVRMRKTTNNVNFALHLLDSLGESIETDTTVLTSDALIKDIDAYRDGIVQNHVFPFSHISKGEFTARLEQIKSCTGISADSILVRLLAINAEIEDEHTNIFFRELRYYPLYCFYFKEGVFITKTDEAYSKLLFARVVAIERVPIDRVIEKITPLLSDKNKRSIQEEAPKMLLSPAIMHGLGIAPGKDSLTLTVQTLDDQVINTTIAAKKYFDITTTKNNLRHLPLRYSAGGNYWFKYDSVANYIYFKYARCQEDSSYPFERFQEAFFKVLKEKKPKKVIIDLRDNRGGHPGILRPFIDELSATAYNKPGRIYVLIGRKTFSAAIHNLVYMGKTLTIKTIGESTSGSANHYGAIKTFELPNTHMKVVYSTRREVSFQYTNGPIKPDVLIEESILDFMRGNDPVFNYAKAD